MRKILQQKEKPARPHDRSGAGGVLRETAKEVNLSLIKTKKIQNVLKEMSKALKSQDDGVAIAAPQIGYKMRIFIVSGKIFAKDFMRKTEIQNQEPHPNPLLEKERGKTPKDLIFINPKISKLSREKEWMPEGCLSVRWLYGSTLRSKKATITAYDENGKKFTRGASGLLAQIFQHETDHLNGILFIDHAKDVKEELPVGK